jgi:predicted dehydrogenase
MRWLAFCLYLCAAAGAERELRLITVDPAHFHAAQLHIKPIAGFSRDAWVYAPVGKDLIGYLNFIANLKTRSATPDYWRYHIYSGDDFFERVVKEHPGDVVMLSGRNSKTIDYISRSVDAGFNVLADKPWIIDESQFPKLEKTLAEADRKGVMIYDCMSQRFDIVYQLQREFVNDPEIFGSAIAGTAETPTVEMASTHFLLKRFGGIPNLRPPAYFDIRQQGEAFADIGTHVVDLTHWTLFAGKALDYKKDIRIVSARRWPTIMTLSQFSTVTAEPQFPAYLAPDIRAGKLEYFANNSVVYTVRGHHVKLGVTWEFESPSGANDSMVAIYRGSRSEVMARQTAAEKYALEVYITPKASDRATVIAAIDRRLQALATRYPGLTRREDGERIHIVIPEKLRTPDIEYFLLLAEQFAGFIRKPDSMPAWEKPNMLAKYWVTTQGVKAARQ